MLSEALAILNEHGDRMPLDELHNLCFAIYQAWQEAPIDWTAYPRAARFQLAMTLAVAGVGAYQTGRGPGPVDNPVGKA